VNLISLVSVVFWKDKDWDKQTCHRNSLLYIILRDAMGCRENELAAAALAAADTLMETQEQEKRDKEELRAAQWAADTQLQLSQQSYLDAADEEQCPDSSSSLDAIEDAAGDKEEGG
jgi:hypothetical protein